MFLAGGARIAAASSSRVRGVRSTSWRSIRHRPSGCSIPNTRQAGHNMSAQPEPWLRGPVPGIPGPLQPAAHALIMAREDVSVAVAGLSDEQLWLEPGGATP